MCVLDSITWWNECGPTVAHDSRAGYRLPTRVGARCDAAAIDATGPQAASSSFTFETSSVSEKGFGRKPNFSFWSRPARKASLG